MRIKKKLKHSEAGPKISTQLISKAAIWHGLSDHDGQILLLENFANCDAK
jgi:hypothetical protein